MYIGTQVVFVIFNTVSMKRVEHEKKIYIHTRRKITVYAKRVPIGPVPIVHMQMIYHFCIRVCVYTRTRGPRPSAEDTYFKYKTYTHTYTHTQSFAPPSFLRNPQPFVSHPPESKIQMNPFFLMVPRQYRWAGGARGDNRQIRRRHGPLVRYEPGAYAN